MRSALFRNVNAACSETSVRNYHFTQRNIPQERTSLRLCGGSLMSDWHWFIAVLCHYLMYCLRQAGIWDHERTVSISESRVFSILSLIFRRVKKKRICGKQLLAFACLFLRLIACNACSFYPTDFLEILYLDFLLKYVHTCQFW